MLNKKEKGLKGMKVDLLMTPFFTIPFIVFCMAIVESLVSNFDTSGGSLDLLKLVVNGFILGLILRLIILVPYIIIIFLGFLCYTKILKSSVSILDNSSICQLEIGNPIVLINIFFEMILTVLLMLVVLKWGNLSIFKNIILLFLIPFIINIPNLLLTFYMYFTKYKIVNLGLVESIDNFIKTDANLMGLKEKIHTTTVLKDGNYRGNSIIEYSNNEITFKSEPPRLYLTNKDRLHILQSIAEIIQYDYNIEGDSLEFNEIKVLKYIVQHCKDIRQLCMNNQLSIKSVDQIIELILSFESYIDNLLFNSNIYIIT